MEQMDEDGYDGVRPVLISECNNQNAANLLEHGIHAKWPDARVDIVPCSGLCSFYAQVQGVMIIYLFLSCMACIRCRFSVCRIFFGITA